VATAKTYIIYYSWLNTVNNHSGMAYFVRELKRALPMQTRLVEIPQTINKWNFKLQRLHFYILSFWLKRFLSKTDNVLFMEYLGNCSGNQTGLALKLRKLGVKNQFIGLVHLSGQNLLELYGTTEYIKKGAEALDKILVFGSSLGDFFTNLGYKDKLITTFHYVDTNYYRPSAEPKSEKLQVIHLGSIKRNFEQLKEIVKTCPEIDFHICQGHLNLSDYFKDQENVKLYGFLSETELLKLMQSCHVSLSILYDTVGSNVITTSMACGLVNVVSNVGSIRDYCNNENAIICNGIEDFIEALVEVSKNIKLFEKLSVNANIFAQKINLEQSIKFFKYFLINGE
jgi:glycosyltransferase involved in cell wall biosynthesis